MNYYLCKLHMYCARVGRVSFTSCGLCCPLALPLSPVCSFLFFSSDLHCYVQLRITESWVYVSTSGLTEREKKTPCLVRSWQQTIKVFTPAMSGAESRRLKEERIRGIGEGEERAGVASRDRVVFSDLQEIILPWVLEVFPFEVRSSPQCPLTQNILYGYIFQYTNLCVCVILKLFTWWENDMKPVMSVFVWTFAFSGLSFCTEK